MTADDILLLLVHKQKKLCTFLTIILIETGHFPLLNTLIQAEWQFGCHSHFRNGVKPACAAKEATDQINELTSRALG